jgi:hypothetical protein
MAADCGIPDLHGLGLQRTAPLPCHRALFCLTHCYHTQQHHQHSLGFHISCCGLMVAAYHYLLTELYQTLCIATIPSNNLSAPFGFLHAPSPIRVVDWRVSAPCHKCSLSNPACLVMLFLWLLLCLLCWNSVKTLPI